LVVGTSTWRQQPFLFFSVSKNQINSEFKELKGNQKIFFKQIDSRNNIDDRYIKPRYIDISNI